MIWYACCIEGNTKTGTRFISCKYLYTQVMELWARGCTRVSRESVRQRLVHWWNVVSQTPPTVFKSYKWNLLWHLDVNFREARSKYSRLMHILSKFLYIHISLFHVTSRDSSYIHTINDSSSFNWFFKRRFFSTIVSLRVTCMLRVKWSDKQCSSWQFYGLNDDNVE